MAAAPSTAPENPLEESLAKIMDKSSLSKDAGTADLLSYENQGFRQPQADVINISGSPGTGATTSETWSHDIALENLRREQMQFEYEQQQADIANALRQQEAMRAQAESARQEAQLGLTKQTTAQQLATSQQQMGSEAQRQKAAEQAYGYAATGEVRSAAEAAQKAQMNAQAMAIQAAVEKRAADEAYFKYGGLTPAQIEASKGARAAALGPGYYVPGNTGVTYYGGSGQKIPQNAVVAPSGASGYNPVTNQWAYPPSPQGNVGYFNRATGQWAYR